MPYASSAQRRFFHTDTARKAGITPKMTREYDEASKGKKMPEHVKKAELMKIAELVKGAKEELGFFDRGRIGAASNTLGMQYNLRHPVRQGIVHAGIPYTPALSSQIAFRNTDPSEREKELKDIARTAVERKGHFGRSFLYGAKRGIVPGAVLGAGIGSIAGGASDGSLSGVLGGGGIGAGIGAIQGALIGGIQSSISDSALGRIKKKHMEKIIKNMRKRPYMGSAVALQEIKKNK